MARKAVAAQRDFAAEMRAIVAAECIGTYVATDKANEIVDKLTATDAALLIGFSRQLLVNHIREFINANNRTQRASSRRAAQRTATQQQLQRALETGDTTELAPRTNFLGQFYVVNAERLQMPYGQTGRPERQFIIADYKNRAYSMGLQRAFHEAVQKRCGNKITGQVFDEDKLAALYRHVVGETD